MIITVDTVNDPGEEMGYAMRIILDACSRRAITLEAAPVVEAPVVESIPAVEAPVEAPPKRKRGRPRKAPTGVHAVETPAAEGVHAVETPAAEGVHAVETPAAEGVHSVETPVPEGVQAAEHIIEGAKIDRDVARLALRCVAEDWGRPKVIELLEGLGARTFSTIADDKLADLYRQCVDTLGEDRFAVLYEQLRGE